jgi:hypothetical protein
MNHALDNSTLAKLVASMAIRLHIVKMHRGISARAEHQGVTDCERVFVDGQPLIDVPGDVLTMSVGRASGIISDLLLAQAYPHGL